VTTLAYSPMLLMSSRTLARTSKARSRWSTALWNSIRALLTGGAGAAGSGCTPEQTDLAVEHFETSVRLSPRDRTAGRLTGTGIAQFFSRRFNDAAATLLLSLEELPTHATPHRFLASCYAHMGRLDEAREIVKRLRTITPVVVPSLIPYRNPEQRELFLTGLRLAAGEAA